MIIAACEAIKNIEESLRNEKEELWLQLHVGDSIRCKIDIRDEEELKFITKVIDKLGTYLSKYLFIGHNRDIEQYIPYYEKDQRVEKEEFEQHVQEICNSFEHYRNNYEQYEYMTFAHLARIIAEHNIPHDVRLMSDSGWECDATDMNGVFYNATENVLVFTRNSEYSEDTYQKENGWKMISEEVGEVRWTFEHIMRDIK